MLLHKNKLGFRVSFLSSFIQTHPQTITYAATSRVSRVSDLINQPNWENNQLLNSLASHITPYEASKIIHLHSSNIQLGLRFFKWVSNQSTYCYDLDARILLLSLLVSSNLFGISHKAIMILLKDCCNGETQILKLMGAFDDLRRFGFCLNYPCYSALLMSLAKLDMGLLAFLVYRRMVDDGFVLGLIDYRSIINALCKNGFVKAAEMFLCRILELGYDLDSHICTSLVMGYCRENNLQDAFRVFDKMSKSDGFGPNCVTYSILIYGLCQQGKLDEAFCLKEKMSEKGCLPSTRTYTVLLKALCDFRLINKALSLVNEMLAKGCKPNVHTYTILIDGLCRDGKIEEANGLFKDMLKSGIFPGTVTFNTLINGYCKNGRIVPAFELLSVMERRNCKPNIRTYNEIMDGLCRAGKSHKAMFLLKRVVDNGLLPTRVTYNILIDGFCKENQLGIADRVLEAMNTFGLEPDVFSFTPFIDWLCKQGRPEQASSILGIMIKKGIFPDEVTFSALIDGYCKIGEIGTASVILERMMENRILTTSHAFNSLVDVFSRDKEVHEGQAMLGNMLKHGILPSAVTYTILINGLCQAGNVAGALKMFELMKLVGCSPNVYTYTVVIKGLCQIGRIEEAEMLLFCMPDLGVSPNHITYTVVIKALVNAHKLERAFELLSTMIQNGCQPNSRIYSALLAGFVQSNITNGVTLHSTSDEKICTSTDAFREMDQEHALKIEEKIKSCGGSAIELYNILVKSLCKEGKLAEADHITRDVMSRGLFPEKAVECIINYYIKEHLHEYCLSFMETILSFGFVPSVSCYCSVIHYLHNADKVEQAQELISDLLKYNGVEEIDAVLPYVEFVIKEERTDQCLDFLKLVEQVHSRERPCVL
ncbi:hypothetical protein UlMin_045837 [Ulmus minor]